MKGRGETMKMVKIISILGFSVALSFLFESRASAQLAPVVKPPMITHAFAAEKGTYHNGYIWKIYIEADAGDGTMSRIASVVDQPSAGRYPTDWINLNPKYQKHLKGYIQWNVHSASGNLVEGTMITLRVSIFDKANRESNVAVFYFTFESGVKDQYKLPAPFDQEDMPRLGYIKIDLLPLGGGYR